MAEVRHAEVNWSGDLQTGAGIIKYVTSGVFSRLPVSWASRTSAHNGKTSPEELLAAAHASCFSMAFSARLGKNGTPPQDLNVRAEVTFDQVDGGLEGHDLQAHRPGRGRRHRRCDVPAARRGRSRQLPDLEGPRRERPAVRRRAARRGLSFDVHPLGGVRLSPPPLARAAGRGHRGRLRGARTGRRGQPHDRRLARPDVRIRAGRGSARAGLRRRPIGVHRPLPVDRPGRRRDVRRRSRPRSPRRWPRSSASTASPA